MAKELKLGNKLQAANAGPYWLAFPTRKVPPDRSPSTFPLSFLSLPDPQQHHHHLHPPNIFHLPGRRLRRPPLSFLCASLLPYTDTATPFGSITLLRLSSFVLPLLPILRSPPSNFPIFPSETSATNLLWSSSSLLTSAVDPLTVAFRLCPPHAVSLLSIPRRITTFEAKRFSRLWSNLFSKTIAT